MNFSLLKQAIVNKISVYTLGKGRALLRGKLPKARFIPGTSSLESALMAGAQIKIPQHINGVS